MHNLTTAFEMYTGTHVLGRHLLHSSNNCLIIIVVFINMHVHIIFNNNNYGNMFNL